MAINTSANFEEALITSESVQSLQFPGPACATLPVQNTAPDHKHSRTWLYLFQSGFQLTPVRSFPIRTFDSPGPTPPQLHYQLPPLLLFFSFLSPLLASLLSGRASSPAPPPAAPSSPRRSGRLGATRRGPLRSAHGRAPTTSGTRERQPRAAGPGGGRAASPEGRAGQAGGGREGRRPSVRPSVHRSRGSVPGFVVLAARAAG